MVLVVVAVLICADVISDDDTVVGEGEGHVDVIHDDGC